MTKTYHFIRHGETDYNRLRIVQGSGVDSELNLLGRQQAMAFYNHYKKYPFEQIICSELKRSYQTIEPFVENQAIPFQRSALINEISWGIHEGQKGNPQMIERYKEMVAQWSAGNFDASLPGAESARQLADRAGRFLAYLVDLPYKNILICTHGRTLRCLLCLMKKQHLREMETYRHSNTGLFLSRYHTGKFEVVIENDTGHLGDFPGV